MGMTAMKIIMSVINSDPPKLKDPKMFSKDFNNFIKACLVKDPERRPTASDLLKHKFLAKAADESYLVSEFLHNTKDLKDRIDEGLIKLGKEFLERRNCKKKSKKSKKKKAKKSKKDKEPDSSEGAMWNFGSGSYTSQDLKKKMSGEDYKDPEVAQHK